MRARVWVRNKRPNLGLFTGCVFLSFVLNRYISQSSGVGYLSLDNKVVMRDIYRLLKTGRSMARDADAPYRAKKERGGGEAIAQG